jgi:hypothetical protein
VPQRLLARSAEVAAVVLRSEEARLGDGDAWSSPPGLTAARVSAVAPLKTSAGLNLGER